MKNRINLTLKITFVCFVLSTLSSCLLTHDTFTSRKQKENYRSFMFQQKQREEEHARERFRLDVNRAFSIVAPQLTIELYNKLGKGEMAENDFVIEHISYYYSSKQAECPINVWWRKKRREIVISGKLIYQDGYVVFYCTNAQNTLPIYKKYIQKLVDEGIAFSVY